LSWFAEGTNEEASPPLYCPFFVDEYGYILTVDIA
jgi:hypothetical protein